MKVNHENINQYIQDKFGAGAKVIGKLDSGKIVVRTANGSTQTFNESQVSNHTVTAGERAKQANLSALSAQAKATVQTERQVERQAKVDTVAAVGEEVRLKRERLQKENKFASDYNV